MLASFYGLTREAGHTLCNEMLEAGQQAARPGLLLLHERLLAP